MKTISKFRGEYAFLSNFYILNDGKSVEHYYQAAKCTNISDYLTILSASTPTEAKRLGKKIEIRRDWDQIKLIVMERLLIKKFSDPILAEKLVNTLDYQLIEGNEWGDTFWGVCNGVGHNYLGRMLMNIRDEFLDVQYLMKY